MTAGRTFGNKLAGGFALTAVLTVLMGAASVAALTVVTSSKDEVIASATGRLVATERLNTAVHRAHGISMGEVPSTKAGPPLGDEGLVCLS